MTNEKPRISLCAITGNAERYIDRWLDAFQPHVDEIILIRAIGNQEPDRTLDIAQQSGCIIGEYRNAEGNDWPHVDDFAAARNMAFDMASHDWVMWADMDDIIENGDQIREELSAMPDEAQALGVPYDIRDDNLRIIRERIIRKGAAKWINPIHEQLNFKDGSKHCETDRFQIVHLPIGNRKANDERNVRILESIKEPTGSQQFHLVQSLRAVGRIEDCINLAAKLAMDPLVDIGIPERYELYFTLAQLNPDPAQRSALMLQALALDPTRREAYGDLAMGYIAQGQPEGAMALAQAMQALPIPEKRPWNLRPKYYGYAAPLIHGVALRALGRVREADTREINHFIRHDARISLLHATRGRGAMAAETRRKWLDTALDPDGIEHIFGLDIDDEQALGLSLHRHVVLDGSGGPVAAWNAAAQSSQGKVLVQLSDDWEPFHGWDKAILDAIGDTSKSAVLKVNDGSRQDDLLCMAIMTRARYEQQGYMFHPAFWSMFSDNYFTDCAIRDRVIIESEKAITFRHIHPAFGLAELDETYARSNAAERYEQGFEIYQRLKNEIEHTNANDTGKGTASAASIREAE